MFGRLVAAILAAMPLVVMAQSYPTKPVRVVVPYPAGSTPDIIGRTLAERLQKAFGQPFVVENRSGAGGSIGAEAVAKAAPDGHTLLIGGNGPVAINKHLYKSLSYDPDRELAPISLLAVAPQMLVARPELKVEDFRAFIEHARRNPGRLSYASVGGGSASHLTMELLKSDARIGLVHVPYRGFPPAVTDLLAGNIDAMFAIIPAVLPHVKAGKMTRPRGDGVAAQSARAGGAERRRARYAGAGIARLERLARVRGHAGGHDCAAERGNGARNAQSGDAGSAWPARIRRRRRLAG